MLQTKGPMPAADLAVDSASDRRARHRRRIFDRLLDAAGALITNRGLEHTTVLDITEAADVGKGTFFRYFACKEHVVPALLERAGAAYQQAVDRARSGESVIKLLEELAGPNTQTPGLDHPAMFRSQVIAVLAKDDIRELSMRCLAAEHERMKALLTIGQERGEIRQDYPAGVLAELIQDAALGARLRASWRSSSSPGDSNNIASRQIVITLIRAPREGTPPPARRRPLRNGRTAAQKSAKRSRSRAV